MSRGMKEVAAKGGTSWLIVDDRAYCHQHYQPGVMQHLDGALSEHPAMAVDG
jgi:hypothetical protein